jgi:hypothetical protein
VISSGGEHTGCLFLAIWHLANGLPGEGHLGQLKAFISN